MKKYIGVDLGTSSVKLLLVSRDGHIEKTAAEEYPLVFPEPGWSEQDPVQWWEAFCRALKSLLKDVDVSEISAIGTAGQMHGLVVLDKDDNVIRPAILWNDSRSQAEVDYLNNEIGKQRLSKLTGNIAFAGFTAPKLLWMKKHEHDNFYRIRKIMLPKDYINYRLTGAHVTDYSDASGTLLLDVENRKWSEEMMEICEVTYDRLPVLHESHEVIGTVRKKVAEELGLPEGVKVVAGAGDNAAAALGTGVAGGGLCNISLGTSGTIFISSDTFRVDPENALHSFAHADGGYHLMGCILSAASCNKWFYEDIMGTNEYEKVWKNINLGSLGRNSVFFLPYLMGERSPINDTDVRGTFVGLSMATTKYDMAQAIMEGVAFALRDCLEVAQAQGIQVYRSFFCGGGAKSELWRRIICNVLKIDLDIPGTEAGPGMGAAMLAMVGDGAYDSVSSCMEEVCFVKKSEEVKPELAAMYDQQYAKFKLIYPSVREMYRKFRILG